LYLIRPRIGRKDISQEPGLRFVAPFSTVRRYSTTVRQFSIDKPSDSPPLRGVDCRSFDKVIMACRLDVEYRLDKTKAKNFFEQFGEQEESNVIEHVQTRLENRIGEAIRMLVPQYPVSYLLHNREELKNNVLLVLGAKGEWSKGTIRVRGAEGELEPNLPKPIERVEMPSIPGRIDLSETGVMLQEISISFDLPKDYLKELESQAMLIQSIETKRLERNNNAALHKTEEERLGFLKQEEAARLEVETIRGQRWTNFVNPSLRIFLERWDGRLPQWLSVDGNAALGKFFEGVTSRSMLDQITNRTVASTNISVRR
jgi:hypothetical protein